jgi:mannose-6-phosphate isomerase-like protein (cupin superfamily)
LASSYTLKRLPDVEDSAPKFGLAEVQEARFASEALETEATGVSFHRLKPGRRQGFGHRHDQAEEVYVVVSGSGRVKVDDEIVDLRPLDALRVVPTSMRQFEAGPEGLEWVAFGPRHSGDGEIVPGWWS